jgi:hypothetical protein
VDDGARRFKYAGPAGALRKLRCRVAYPLPSDEIAKLIEDYLSWEIVINTPQAIIAALAIEARYKIYTGTP